MSAYNRSNNTSSTSPPSDSHRASPPESTSSVALNVSHSSSAPLVSPDLVSRFNPPPAPPAPPPPPPIRARLPIPISHRGRPLALSPVITGNPSGKASVLSRPQGYSQDVFSSEKVVPDDVETKWAVKQNMPHDLPNYRSTDTNERQETRAGLRWLETEPYRSVPEHSTGIETQSNEVDYVGHRPSDVRGRSASLARFDHPSGIHRRSASQQPFRGTESTLLTDPSSRLPSIYSQDFAGTRSFWPGPGISNVHAPPETQNRVDASQDTSRYPIGRQVQGLSDDSGYHTDPSGSASAKQNRPETILDVTRKAPGRFRQALQKFLPQHQSPRPQMSGELSSNQDANDHHPEWTTAPHSTTLSGSRGSDSPVSYLRGTDAVSNASDATIKGEDFDDTGPVAIAMDTTVRSSHYAHDTFKTNDNRDGEAVRLPVSDEWSTENVSHSGPDVEHSRPSVEALKELPYALSDQPFNARDAISRHMSTGAQSAPGSLDSGAHSEELENARRELAQARDDEEHARRKVEEARRKVEEAILQGKNSQKQSLGLPGGLDIDEAQMAIDAIHEKLRSGYGTDPGSKMKFLRLLTRLCVAYDLFPEQLYIEAQCENGGPVNGGSFADIYVGRSQKDRKVALKRLRIFLTTSDVGKAKLRRNFYREAILWAHCRHPHVLPFLGLNTTIFRSGMCMVSPWMEHGNVCDYVRQHPQDRSMVDSWICEIALGLEYLHQEEIAHGDLRAANVLVDDELHMRVADFGLATLSDDYFKMTTIDSQQPHWLAPELLIPTHFGLPPSTQPTKAGDMYAFACVCFELYTGRPPFANLGPHDIIGQIIKEKQPARPLFNAGADSMSDDLCNCCFDEVGKVGCFSVVRLVSS
ncbi:unnamed protein product [Somion occarium]|uniref:Protein kinase domain-containing protein n=1 Tax=Somion occarium TaxID=3059160 RepID=A0ABP1DZH7_9APHY